MSGVLWGVHCACGLRHCWQSNCCSLPMCFSVPASVIMSPSISILGPFIQLGVMFCPILGSLCNSLHILDLFFLLAHHPVCPVCLVPLCIVLYVWLFGVTWSSMLTWVCWSGLIRLSLMSWGLVDRLVQFCVLYRRQVVPLNVAFRVAEAFAVVQLVRQRFYAVCLGRSGWLGLAGHVGLVGWLSC